MNGFIIIGLILLLVAFVISVVGNVLIIIVLIREKHLKQMTVYPFITSIAVVDLLMGLMPALIVILIICENMDIIVSFFKKELKQDKTQGYFCLNQNKHKSVKVFAAAMSIVWMSMTIQIGSSIDRYFAVCHPMTFYRNKSSGHPKWNIAVCIITALLMEIWFVSEIYSKRFLKVFGLFSLVTLSVLLILNGLICWSIYVSLKSP